MLSPNPLFLPEELIFRPKVSWPAELDLLNEKGVFFLKDVAVILGFKTFKMIAYLKRLAGGEPLNAIYSETGIRKALRTHYVRMSVFSKFYRTHFLNYCPRLPSGKTLAGLVNETAPILLTDMARLIPERPLWWLRYYGKRHEDSGVYLDETNHWLCVPKVFIPWLESQAMVPTIESLGRAG